jgi:hypothetical protein
MKINFVIVLIVSIFLSGGLAIANDSLAAVSLAGGIIKAKNVESTKKYKRKDCPVCKGKGWYISGDGIEKVKCGYCEDDNGSATAEKPETTNNSTQHRTIIRRR